MKRRRVIGGQVYMQTRSGGWRLVMNGCIRTRRGWRRLQRPTQRRRAPAPTIPVAKTVAPITATIAPIISEQTAAEPMPRRQWGGKYDQLRTEAHAERPD